MSDWDNLLELHFPKCEQLPDMDWFSHRKAFIPNKKVDAFFGIEAGMDSNDPKIGSTTGHNTSIGPLEGTKVESRAVEPGSNESSAVESSAVEPSTVEPSTMEQVDETKLKEKVDDTLNEKIVK